MEKDVLFLAKTSAWTLTCGLCWVYAARGYGAWPQVDRWLFGALFWLHVSFLAIGVGVFAFAHVARAK